MNGARMCACLCMCVCVCFPYFAGNIFAIGVGVFVRKFSFYTAEPSRNSFAMPVNGPFCPCSPVSHPSPLTKLIVGSKRDLLPLSAATIRRCTGETFRDSTINVHFPN